MSDNNCVILFDQNDHCTYFTGQVVTGRVMVTFKKSKKIKGIKLQVCGYAACQWREKRGRKRPITSSKKCRKHIYSGREDYIASTTFLVGSEDGKNFSMDAGTYTYTFACPIPYNCPSSFEGTYGHVRYVVKVTFLRAGASDRTHNVGFTVLKLVDLNQESNLLKTPASNEAMENFCFFHTTAVNLNIHLVQTGYVPGQFILVNAFVNNGSSIDCKKLMIALNLRATYTSDTPSMHNVSEKMCLVKKFCGPVSRHSQRHYAETIRVPATPPTSEHLCKVVRVSYEICVVAIMNHFMLNPKAVIPITIGNVPLVDDEYGEPTTPPSAPVNDNRPSTSAAAMRQQSQIDEDGFSMCDEETEGENEMDMPPPTYEEAMFMTANIADDDVNTVSDATQFTPRYPVYDVDNPMVGTPPGEGPPPNPPQKRRRRKKKKSPTMVPISSTDEKLPVESPVQI